MSMNSETIRPRRRGLWWKAPLAATGVLTIAALVAHAVWTARERGRAEMLVAAIRASGEPIDPADLADPPMPADENVVTLIQAALDAYRADAALEAREREIDDAADDAFAPPLTDAERAVLTERTAANAAALQILAGLDGRSAVAWADAYASPLMLREDVDFMNVRRLANLLGDRARLAADAGRSAEAVAALRDVHPLAAAVGQKPSLIGYLVGVGVDALAADRAIELAPTLTVADAEARADVARLIAELLDDAAVERMARRGIIGERASGHDTFAALSSGRLSLAQVAGGGNAKPGGLGNRLVRWTTAPILYRGDATTLAYHTEALRHLDAPSSAAFKREAVRLTQMEADVMDSKLDVFTRIMLPSMARAYETRYRVVTERHVAACALAIRLHALDHNGRRPATLNELVPAYLPAVPIDAHDGAPIRYDPAQAILWAVGEDGVDGSGDPTTKRPEDARERWRMRDAVVWLDRPSRLNASPATTRAGVGS